MRYVLCHFTHWSLKGSAASTRQEKIRYEKERFNYLKNVEKVFHEVVGFTSLCKLNKNRIAVIFTYYNFVATLNKVVTVE